MGCDCGPLRRRHSGEGCAVSERCSSILIPSLWCDQPASTDGTGAWGVVHERDLSIKQDKECADSGDGPRARSATERQSEWTCLQTQQSETARAARGREYTASRVCGGSHAPNSSIARWWQIDLAGHLACDGLRGSPRASIVTPIA
jgi:hypothetical protein